MPQWLCSDLVCHGFAPSADWQWSLTLRRRGVEVVAIGGGGLAVAGTADGRTVWGSRLDPGYTPGMARSLLTAATTWAACPDPAPAA